MEREREREREREMEGGTERERGERAEGDWECERGHSSCLRTSLHIKHLFGKSWLMSCIYTDQGQRKGGGGGEGGKERERERERERVLCFMEMCLGWGDFEGMSRWRATGGRDCCWADSVRRRSVIINLSSSQLVLFVKFNANVWLEAHLLAKEKLFKHCWCHFYLASDVMWSFFYSNGWLSGAKRSKMHMHAHARTHVHSLALSFSVGGFSCCIFSEQSENIDLR